MEKITKSEEETIKFAKEIAAKLKGGETILLYGDLGAGKTLFVKGLAKALGFKQNIISPTFSLMKIYNLNDNSPINKICHADLYRLEKEQDIIELGILDYINQEKTLCLIEWPEKIKNLLKTKLIEIYFKHIDLNQRKISIKGL